MEKTCNEASANPEPISGSRASSAEPRRESTCGDPAKVGESTRSERSEPITLGPEVWQRVFNWRIYRHTVSLLREIFGMSVGFTDWPAIGISLEEFTRIRGPQKEPPILVPFCELIRQSEKGREACILESERAGERMRSTGKIEIWKCFTGLTCMYIPIMINNKYSGALATAGGFLLDEPTQAEWDQIAQRIRNINVDIEQLRKLYFEIKPKAKGLFEVVLRLFAVLIEEIFVATVEVEEDKKRVIELESALYGKYKFEKIIGKSPVMQEVFKLLRRVIDTDNPILIEGETGTGKELLAHAIHYHSPRQAQPFLALNCGTLTETLLESELFGHLKGSFTGATRDKKGLFEVADKGTVFLDEVAEMSPSLQVKLLRVIQEGTFLPVGCTQPRKVDVRIISATNKDLKILVEQGKFREDLYYRLNVIKIVIPPLRERKEDIPLLIEHFIKTNPLATKKKILGLRENALKMLLDYHWPGNIRELQNALERAFSLATSQYITPEELPEEIRKKVQKDIPLIESTLLYKEIMPQLEKEYLIKLLAQTNGNITKAASLSGLHRSSLRNLLRKYHLGK